jgi:hypothetical protein
MTARNPREIREDLKVIARQLKAAADEYEWAFHYAHSNSRRAGFDGGNRPGHSDPTSNLVAGTPCPVKGCGDTSGECGHGQVDAQTRMRQLLEKNDEDIAEARRALERTRRRTKRLRYKPFDLTGLPDDGPQVSKADIIDAHEAKARREARGESFGDG